MSSSDQARSNRFDTMRLVFAIAVMVAHIFMLSDLPGSRPYQQMSGIFAELSIRGFFILSGGLVYASWLRSRSVGQYAAKRVRRLYPVYSAIVIACAIAALIFAPEARADLGAVGKYLLANLVFLNFLHPDLPGVFEGNRFSEVNGALWTIKIEVMFYIAVPILVWMMGLFGRFKFALLVLIYIAAEVWRAGFGHIGAEQNSGLLIQLSRQLPGQMSFFVAGIFMWEFRALMREKWWMFSLAGLTLTSASFLPYGEPLCAAGWAALIGGIAFSPGPELNAARFGDFSYGIYSAHFPIIQLVIALGLFQVTPFGAAAIAVIATFIIAVFCWNFVEKPFLARSNWYRRQSG
ncbi:acyltransferase [Ponticaulis sp.]|uniref:acyltransferase family protein n=1 Tax=Ponticaulis sp. TaxID=2020902 RepID=UPI0025E2F09E|nr:acyltransferase [Ponticaulis sp.]